VVDDLIGLARLETERDGGAAEGLLKRFLIFVLGDDFFSALPDWCR
jgi:hypothetical protein